MKTQQDNFMLIEETPSQIFVNRLESAHKAGWRLKGEMHTHVTIDMCGLQEITYIQLLTKKEMK